MGTGDKGEEEREIREVVEKGQDGMINEEEEVRRWGRLASGLWVGSCRTTPPLLSASQLCGWSGNTRAHKQEGSKTTNKHFVKLNVFKFDRLE